VAQFRQRGATMPLQRRNRGEANTGYAPRCPLRRRPTHFKLIFLQMVEPLLSGIVLGLIPVTLSGLFVTAYLQYRRGDQMNF